MDPQRSAQHVLCCGLCQDPVALMYCNTCNIYMCNACVGSHVSELSHKILPLKQRGSDLTFPRCPNHSTIQCDVFCDPCDIPICVLCAASNEHEGHMLIDVLTNFDRKKELLRKDLEELEIEKENMDKKMDDSLDDNEYETNERIKCSKMKWTIIDLKELLESNDVCKISTYKSRNVNKEMSGGIPLSPNTSSQELDDGNLYEEADFMSESSLSQIEVVDMQEPDSLEDEFEPEIGELLDLPEIVATVDTQESESLKDEFEPEIGQLLDMSEIVATVDTGLVFSVVCRGEEEIWTRGRNKFMKLYDLQGNLLQSIQSSSRNVPEDIAVTRSKDLVYTDFDDSSVNIVKDEKVEKKIALHGWKPRNICCTSSDDLLVTMDNDDETQSKVVRFNNFEEIQTIQRDDYNLPLYSSGGIKYINENKNLDICVADNLAEAVVVVNQAGKLRFKYTGHPSKTSFHPAGITSDAQRRILTADCVNHCIHILNEAGQFLKYIENVGFKFPCGLCIDSGENLLVATQSGFIVLRYYIA
ncbi:uncharacterized protein LOC111129727 [Crassostrea virginica]